MMGTLGTVKDAAIGWVIQGILGSLFTEKMEAWWREVDVAGDVENLKSEMLSTNTVVDAARGRKIENEGLSRSLFHLKQLLYDAEDVMDELDYHRLQREIEGGNCDGSAAGTHPLGDRASSSSLSSALQKPLNAVKQISDWALGKHRKRKREDDTLLALESKQDTISQRINKIVTQLRTAREDLCRVLPLEISRPITMPYQSQSEPRNSRLTTSMQVEKVYGREAERNRVVELLTKGNYSDLHVLPIVGGGGVGKTTLARFVCNDQRIQRHFDLQMWICVSTIFDQVRLTREMLEHACKDGQDYGKISSFNVLQDTLLKNIRNKRFLLVLDDIWEDKDKNGWATLLAPLVSNQEPGCMILATTRSKSVAKMIGTMDAVEMKGLDEKEFWLLFEACAFGNENCTDPRSLHTIGQQIAKTLKGYPLAAQSVGALLKENLSYDHWRDVQETWKSRQQNDGDILPILELSYDYLPSHLQHCFSYCSLFPEDHRFYGETLVRAWISQNFVQCEDTSKRLEEIGMQYLGRLVDLGFFQKVDSHYVMHDLMHELAEKVSSYECANINGLQSKTIQPCIRHLSIITTAYDKDEHGSFPSENFEKILQDIRPLQKLRTLMFFGQSSVNLLRTRSFQILCKDAKSLRLLRIYVAGADIDSVHNFIKPYHLRCLEFIVVCPKTTFASLNNEDIAFPEAFTRFYHLQVLDVGICNISKVPTGMNNLVNLRHLVADVRVHSTIPSIGNMTALQELRMFRVQNASGFEVKQLQSMNKLVHLGISQLRNVKTKEEASRAKLIDKEHLEKLWLSWDDSGMSLEPTTERTRDVLEGLEPHQNLKTLQITGYGGATSPTWLASNVSVTSLRTLRLENCRELRSLQSLEMLPVLRKLTLVRMWNLMEVSIPSLEELVLIKMPKLEKCVGTYGLELTSNLRVLMVKDCPQLNEFTLFQSDTSFQAEQKSWFPSLDKLTIGRCPHIINSEILPLEEMRALKELELMDLHVVRVLSVPPLEKLVLIKMPSLESCSGLTASPPLQLSPSQGEQQEWASSLRKLTIHDCPCLVVSHPLPPSAQLYDLSIKGLATFPTMKIEWRRLVIESSELNVLDGKILAFNNLKGITWLDVRSCPNLISISSEGQLIALERLMISNCPNLLQSHIVSESVQENSTSASILVLPSLKYLSIQSCGMAGRWLTQMLPHLQSLEELQLGYCPQIKFLLISQPTETEATSSMASAATTSAGDEQLLEMPCNLLRSLKRLSISFCPDLEFCGGKGGFGRFTSLVDLQINGCPKLFPSLVGDDGTADVGLLPSSLQNLRIMNLPASLQSCFDKGVPYLKNLRLFYSPYLKCLQLHSCTALEELQIRGCEQLAVLEGLQYLHSLQSLDIEMNPKLSAAWEVGLLPPSLQNLRIMNLPANLQSCFDKGMPYLKTLRLFSSPHLKCLQLHSCTALEELEISGCEQLAVLEGLQYLHSLRSLDIKMNPELSAAWEQEQGGSQIRLFPPSLNELLIGNLTDGVNSRLLPCVPFITRLMVWDSPKLTSLQLGYCTALEELEITDCESLASIEGIQTIRNLRSLTVRCSPSLPACLELVSHQQGASEIWSRLETLEIDDACVLSMPLCKQLTSLRDLKFWLWGKGESMDMVSLTEEQESALQLLTSLQKLCFRATTLLSLPTNLRSLVSLESLEIDDCPSIKRLPEMGLPPSLKYLRLFRCSEELRMQCRMAATDKLSVSIDFTEV